MFILTEETADPNSLRFLPGQPVLHHRTLEIRHRKEAAISPLAERLFQIAEVSALVLGPDHITVTKHGSDWRHLKPVLLGAIMDHFMSGAAMLRETAPPPANTSAEKPAGVLAGNIREALRRVIDPELGYNIVDLGLIYDVAVGDDGNVTIHMTTTTQGCPATAYLSEGARACAASVEGAGKVEVRLTYEPKWSVEMMSDDAKEHFSIRRSGKR
jgi:metal-sulfur cluster biosynthetic enzyme